MLASPSHTAGSVANTLLLHRALGLRCVCCGWYPTCLSLPPNGEESNHLATASSSSSLCLEIERRPRNKATSIIKGFSGDHSHNSVRTTSSPLMLPYFTSGGHILNHEHLNPLSSLSGCFLLICPSLSFNMNQTSLFLFLFHPTVTSPSHFTFLHISPPSLPAPSPPSRSFS